MVIFHFPLLEIPFPDISSPKPQIVDLFCFSILMFTSVQSLVISSQGSTRSDVLKFGPVSEQGAQTRFRKITAIFFRPNVSKMFIDHRVQQMVRQKTQNLELCFGTNMRTNQAKIEKIRARFLERFGSDSCVLQSAPYDVKQIRTTGGA